MNTVVVMNASGTRLMLMGRVIRPLRETTEDQEFQFSDPYEAIAFTDSINSRNTRGMSALYAGIEVAEPVEEIEPVKPVETVEIVDVELMKELKAKSVKELKAMCKKLGISGYSALNEAELIALILENQTEEK